MRRGVGAALMVVMSLAGAAPASASHAGSLAGQWHLDEDADSATSIADSSGHGNDGSPAGLENTSGGGYFGEAMNFGGAQIRVTSASELTPSRVSVTTWMKAANPLPNRHLVAKGGSGCDGSTWAIQSDGGDNLRFYVRVGAAGTRVESPPVPAAEVWDNEWHAVTGTYDGTAVRISFDGALVGSTPASGALAYSLDSQDLVFGRYPNFCGTFPDYSGNLDEIQIYSRALSAGEIAFLHGAPEDQPRVVTDPPPGGGAGGGDGGGPGGGGDGGSAPPPVARFTPLTREPSLSSMYLDARGSSNAARYLWDLNNDGRDDVECGKDEPILTMRQAALGSSAARLTTPSADGRTSSAVQSLGAARAGTLSSRTRAGVTAAVACLGSLGTGTNGSPVPIGCAGRVAFGIIEARGCLDAVENENAVPPRERAIINRLVAEYQSNPQLRDYAFTWCTEVFRRNCRRDAGTLDERELNQVLLATDMRFSRGRVAVNGLSITPHNGATVVFYPQLNRIVSREATVRVGDMVVKDHKELNLDVRSATITNGIFSRAGRQKLADFKPNGLSEIGGFDLGGTATLELVSNGPQRTSQVTVTLVLPSFIFGSSPPTGRVELEANNDRGLVMSDLDFGVPTADVGGLHLERLRFKYTRASDRWKAEGALFLGPPSDSVGLDMAPPPDRNGVLFEGGAFKGFGAFLVFRGAAKPQVFPSVFLDSIDLSVRLDPTVLRGGVVMSAAEVYKVSGSLLAAFPSAAAPFTLTGDEAGQEFRQLAGTTFYTPTIGAGGALAIKVPALGDLDLANGFFVYSYPDYAAVGGRVRIPIALARVTGEVTGKARAATAEFELKGTVEACIEGLGCPAGARGLVSSKGMAACIDTGPVSQGFGHRWGDAIPTVWLFDGCKHSPYWVPIRTPGARAAQAGTSSFAVARGTSSYNVRVASGAPMEVRGPDGETVSTASKQLDRGRRLAILRHASHDVTWIGIKDPVPGTYTVRTLDGSRPGAMRASQFVGDRRIRARVTGRGFRRVLRYDIAREPRGKQLVSFWETGPGGSKFIGSTSGGKGRIRFTPAISKGGRRRIEARLELADMPLTTRVVARYLAPAPPRAHRVRRVRARRRGTRVTARWTKARGASRYRVVLRDRRGVQRVRTVRASRRRLVFRRVATTLGGRVSVVALGRYGDRARPRSARFRATRRARSRFLRFSELRRGARRAGRRT